MNKETSILMYHGIVAKPEDIPKGREEGAELYDVTLDQFKAQMDVLAKDRQDVQITFDDGEENNIINAVPVLKRYGLKAVFFVTVNRVGQDGYMDWEQLKELRDAEMMIGSHGLNHTFLNKMNDSQLEEEIMDSKAILERELHVNVDSFSIPRGVISEKIIKKAKESGYKTVYISEEEYSDDCVFSRIAVKSNWTKERFEQALHHQKPVNETFVDGVKGITKKVFGAEGYNKIRNQILKKRK